MVIDKAGTLAGVKRRDFLPFGEDLASDAAWRTTARGYVGDNVRQKFTGYERDPETGLDYAQARYFASTHGRFTGTDPLLASGRVGAPQTWNRYAYALNNPLRLTDPSGMEAQEPDQGQVQNIPPRQQQRRPVARPLPQLDIPLPAPPPVPNPPAPVGSGPVVTDAGPAPPAPSPLDAAMNVAEQALQLPT